MPYIVKNAADRVVYQGQEAKAAVATLAAEILAIMLDDNHRGKGHRVRIDPHFDGSMHSLIAHAGDQIAGRIDGMQMSEWESLGRVDSLVPSEASPMLKDLGRHAIEKTNKALEDVMDLVDSPTDKFVVGVQVFSALAGRLAATLALSFYERTGAEMSKAVSIAILKKTIDSFLDDACVSAHSESGK